MNATPALLRLAHAPAPSVESGATVSQAVAEMVQKRVGAVAVVEKGRLRGIFTERDLMVKVVGAGKDPLETKVSSVMVADPQCLPPDARRSEALEHMVSGHFRHVPIVDDDGHVLGMLSIRHLLQEQLTRLKDDLDSLHSYMAADGPGG
jgi:CBS domain-containing protein